MYMIAFNSHNSLPFTQMETEAERGHVTCLRSVSQLVKGSPWLAGPNSYLDKIEGVVRNGAEIGVGMWKWGEDRVVQVVEQGRKWPRRAAGSGPKVGNYIWGTWTNK